MRPSIVHVHILLITEKNITINYSINIANMSTGGVSSENTAPMSPMAPMEAGASELSHLLEGTIVAGTRFVEGVGRPEMAGAQSSNQGAVAGSTGSADGNGNINRAGGADPLKGGSRRAKRHHKKHSARRGGSHVPGHVAGRRTRRQHHRRGMRGGSGLTYSTAPTMANVASLGVVGPRAGPLIVESEANCGTVSETSLGAGTQFSSASYPQSGGMSVNAASPLTQEGVSGAANYGFTGGDPATIAALRGSYAPIEGSGYNQNADCYRAGALGSDSEAALAMKDNVPNAQAGGKRGGVCSDLRRVHHFSQVRGFLARSCPSAVMIYDSFLKKYEGSTNHKVAMRLKRIVVQYAKAFCHEHAALHSKKSKVVRRELREMKAALSRAGSELRKMEPGAENAHRMMTNRRSDMVHYHLKHISTMKKHHRGAGWGKGKYGGSHHTMRGGYNQWGSNIPNTPSYGLLDGIPSSLSALANPMYFTVNQQSANCNDNYNHYTGAGFETPVLDQDVVPTA